MSWEYQKVDAALHLDSIPEESIRLRILANSDAPNDQYIKAIVRDVVVESMNGWITEPVSIEEARVILSNHEQELQAIIKSTLVQYGYDYGVDTTIGLVAFPTKMYGNKIYPAGEYEALLITLGKGEGRNWWCVLFPPLCFTDAVAGEATSVTQSMEEVTSTAASSSEISNIAVDNKGQQWNELQADQELEVKFFIVEWFEQIGSTFSSWFK